MSTLTTMNTSKTTPAKVSPLAERLGSSKGRRTISGSSSSRSMKKPPTLNSQM